MSPTDDELRETARQARAIVSGTEAGSRRERRTARRIEGAAAALEALAEGVPETADSGDDDRLSDSST